MTTHSDYEHEIKPFAPHIIWVRSKRDGRNGTQWRAYMHCESAEEAERVLALLKQDMGESAVRE